MGLISTRFGVETTLSQSPKSSSCLRARGWMVQGIVGCLVLVSASGCMSMDEHRRVQARNRMLAAEKEAMAQELADARSAGDGLRMRIDSQDHEANYRCAARDQGSRDGGCADKQWRITRASRASNRRPDAGNCKDLFDYNGRRKNIR